MQYQPASSPKYSKPVLRVIYVYHEVDLRVQCMPFILLLMLHRLVRHCSCC